MSLAKFPMGQLVATPNALQKLSRTDIVNGLTRHLLGDWGEELNEEDRKQNEIALSEGQRLFSVYRSRIGIRFYIITESDRSATTILLPEDY